MSDNKSLTQEDFDALLQWFAPNREDAGAKYEEIRNGLMRYFSFKGCSEVESLADETINRVAKKFSNLDRNNENKHITYFYGFADKIYLEYRRGIERKSVELEQTTYSIEKTFDQTNEIKEQRHECLEKCLATLAAQDKNLIIQYFSKDKIEKQKLRQNLAEQNSLTIGTLRVQIYRLKGTLKNCVGKCLRENSL